jgi:hypothetical protein
MSAFLHFADNEARPTECEARSYKVRPAVNFLVNIFYQVYVPGKQISIDKGMIAWNDRLIFKICMSDKPDRCGIKAYLVSESESYYICNMEVRILANHVKLTSKTHTTKFLETKEPEG